jgi:hypothetical protein
VSSPYRSNRQVDPALAGIPPRPARALAANAQAEGRLTAAVYAASRSTASRLQVLMDTILCSGPPDATTPPNPALGNDNRPIPAVTETRAAAGLGRHAEHRGISPEPGSAPDVPRQKMPIPVRGRQTQSSHAPPWPSDGPR